MSELKSKDNQPDWDKIAEKFDTWLPHIEPVGKAMLEALDAKAGDKVLDVASGTGEPALTLAKANEAVEITGVDAAPGMVKVANKKVQESGLHNISFAAMPVEKLDFDDEVFDKVLCRFGVMLFDDPQQGVQEMHRVLKDGGRYAVAVWGEAENMPTMYWSYQVFKNKVPEDSLPPLEKISSMGAPGAIDTLLANAGFSEINVERHTFDYEFESFDEYWEAVESSDLLKQQYDALSETTRHSIRNEVADFAKEHITENGFSIPHEYLLVWGSK